MDLGEWASVPAPRQTTPTYLHFCDVILQLDGGCLHDGQLREGGHHLAGLLFDTADEGTFES